MPRGTGTSHGPATPAPGQLSRLSVCPAQPDHAAIQGVASRDHLYQPGRSAGLVPRAFPLGKVPILIVNQDTVIFESEVINEYADELSPPSLLPEDPLARAQARAWIEFLSEQTAVLHRWMLAGDENAAAEAHEQARTGLARLEQRVAEDPLFTEREFSLIDAALAPLLMRYALVTDPSSPWDPTDFPHLAARWEHLARLPAVRESVRKTSPCGWPIFWRARAELRLPVWQRCCAPRKCPPSVRPGAFQLVPGASATDLTPSI